jgi:hypothetical protein
MRLDYFKSSFCIWKLLIAVYIVSGSVCFTNSEIFEDSLLICCKLLLLIIVSGSVATLELELGFWVHFLKSLLRTRGLLRIVSGAVSFLNSTLGLKLWILHCFEEPFVHFWIFDSHLLHGSFKFWIPNCLILKLLIFMHLSWIVKFVEISCELSIFLMNLKTGLS